MPRARLRDLTLLFVFRRLIKYPRKRLRETLFSRKGLTPRAGTTSRANSSITFTSLGVARTNFTPVDPQNDMVRRSSALLFMYRNNVQLTASN